MRQLGIAIVTALAAMNGMAGCGKGGASAEVPANAPAGRVVEASGKVEASRGGATRPLASGSEIFRDDVVATATDGTVTIELFHNNARWLVEAGQSKRVDESVAWKLDKQERTAPGDHATSAAGRSGERSAAETHETAKRDRESEGKKGSKDETLDLDARKPPSPIEKPAEKVPVEPQTAVSSGSGGGPGSPGQSGSASLPKIAQAIEKNTEPVDPKTVAPRRLEPHDALRPALEAESPALRACLDAATPKVKFDVLIFNGKITVSMDKVPAPVRTCIEKVVRGIKFSAQGGVTFTIEK